ncbi:serine/threonine-protein kinase PRP4 homolog isoform X2 [Macrobrachium nipponense]|uniref:serine/threonine-protein kinase PRP4 homolog isoform X2 n=1 Tax=Macrobrachium nipponense TaxID=159736 RepID=UPI0030C83736
MPVSPYLTQTSYAVRPYPRNTASNITTSTPSCSVASRYGIADTSVTSAALTGYKAGGYGKSKLPIADEISLPKSKNYNVGRYKSSDNIPESQTLLELRLKKSSSNSTLFSGNTANILKNFSLPDEKGRGCPYLPPKPRVEERKFCGKSGGVSVFASQYLAKVNRGRDFRPREIDTRDINTTVKPRIAPGFHNSEDSLPLTRNSRHVVRLTIKRLEAEDPFVVKDKTIKTIAQRLIEKYTDKEKKADPYEYVPRRRLYEDNESKDSTTLLSVSPSSSITTPPPCERSLPPPPPSSIATSPSIASAESAANSSQREQTLLPATTQPRKKSLAELRATMSPQSSFDDADAAACRLLRATSMAAKKKELENLEEVKDAIIAAVLHPDVDIESDEEMKELVRGDKTPSDSWKDKTYDKQGESSGDHSDEGKAIVGQLKRFVKKQVSTKGPGRKKKSSERKHRSGSQKSRGESSKSKNLNDGSSSLVKEEGVTVKVGEEGGVTVKASSSVSSKKKTSPKDDSSVLSADLIFGTNKSHKLKKSKDKSTTERETTSAILKEEKRPSRESSKKKSGLSLLSPSLVYNNLTSDEENESRPRTPPTKTERTKETDAKDKSPEKKKEGATEKSEANPKDTHNKSESEGAKEKGEKAISKIPKLKKKVKKEPAGGEAGAAAKEVHPEIKVSSPVWSPSSDAAPPERPGASGEKAPDLKEAREADTLGGGINKKNSSKTSATGKDIETSDHHPDSTSRAEPKNAIAGKEIKSVGPEKSLPDEKKEEKLLGEKSPSDLSVELKTSKKSAKEITRGNKDENAVKPKTFGKKEENPPPPPTGDKAFPLLIAKDEVVRDKAANRKDEVVIDDDVGTERNSVVVETLTSDATKDSERNDTSLTKKTTFKKSSSRALSESKPEEIIGKNESETKDVILSSTDEEALVCKDETGKESKIAEVNKDENKSEDKEDKQGELPNGAMAGKKALKRPRQVGPPLPQQENKIGNVELLNARKILKRPIKKGLGVAPADAEENVEQQPTTPEDPNKKLWKRPIAQLVPPKDGDQFLQARNVLKKPVKPKAPPEDKNDNKPTGKLPELKVVKKFRKPGAPTAAQQQQQQKEGSDKDGQKQRSRSPSSSDEEEEEEEGEGGARKAERQRRPPKSRSSKDQKKPPSPSQSPSGTTKAQGSGKDPKLSACQSADSGYGSSPSTPQPTQTMPTDNKSEEEICTGSADGTSRTLASPTKSSSVSASESETTEDESETDTDNDYFGLPEIRPPLQTRPKFKKYTIDDFAFIKVLGKGSYGKVMLAQQKDSENYFAVKCLKKDVVLEDNDVECTLIERKVLSLGTKHPYLCHLFCTFQTPSHLFFVMEYLTGGDLMFHIQHCGRFDEFRACFYAAEITSGLKFLHSKGIIYRDLKLDNILLDYQGHIRIADFGMCKLQVYLDRYADTFCGTPDYMAPEVIKGQHYNQCVDWWSFGVLLYEMLTGKSPFKGCDEDHLFWLICNDEPFFPKFLSMEATEILKALLDKDSNRRLGIPFSPYGEIKDHAFFKYIDWCKIERKEVETPYKPRLRHILDVQYFDRLFTKRHAAITPLDESILATMDQTAFTDFSYTNPNITD